MLERAKLTLRHSVSRACRAPAACGPIRSPAGKVFRINDDKATVAGVARVCALILSQLLAILCVPPEMRCGLFRFSCTHLIPVHIETPPPPPALCREVLASFGGLLMSLKVWKKKLSPQMSRSSGACLPASVLRALSSCGAQRRTHAPACASQGDLSNLSRLETDKRLYLLLKKA